MKLEEAIKFALDGEAVLFLGSGFSSEATNILHENLPIGRELSYAICDEMKINRSDKLSISSERYVDKYGVQSFITFLKKHISCKTVSDNQNEILSLPWKRIYTTNYDDVVEVVSEKLNIDREYVTANKAPKEIKDINGAIIHINGSILNVKPSTFYQEFKITDESYLRDGFLESPWERVFYDDINNMKAIIFIGYSLDYDFDLQKVMHEIIKERAFFIDQENISEEQKYKFEKWGKLYQNGNQGLAKKIVEIKNSYMPLPREEKLQCFKEIKLTQYHSKEIESQDVIAMLVRGEYDEFSFRNKQHYYIRREIILNNILKSFKNGNICLIHSNLGNGKSFLLDYVESKLVDMENISIYKLDKLDEHDLNDDINLIRRNTEKQVYILIDDIDYDMMVLKALSRYQMENVKVIATCRSYIEPLIEEKIRDQAPLFYKGLHVLDIDCLQEVELDETKKLFDKYNLWGDYASSTHSEKKKLLKDRLSSGLSNILYILLDSQLIKDKINELLSKINKDELLKKYLVIKSICDICNFKLPGYEVARLVKISFGELELRARHINNVNIKQIIDLSSSDAQFRSSVFSQYIISEVADNEFILNILVQFHKNISKETSQKYFIIKKKLNGRTNLIEAFGGSRKGKKENDRLDNIIYRFYDKIQNIEKENPFFWLQFAIVSLNLEKLDVAELYFKTAYSYAEKMESFDTFQLDTHYSRYIFVALIKGRIEYSFDEIKKAHNYLMRNNNPEVSYVLKQTGAYSDVYEKYGNSFSSRNKIEFNNMIEIIAKKYNLYFDELITKNFHITPGINNAYKKFEKLLIDYDDWNDILHQKYRKITNKNRR